MVGRPPKENSRDKQYRVRLNNVEDEMLSFCSKETGEAKSEIFRNALRSYYENTKYFKNILNNKENPHEIDYQDNVEYDEYYEFKINHISLKRAIACPYCGVENNMDFEENCECFDEERKMGPQRTYCFDWPDYKCGICGKRFKIKGSIWEYPLGSYNYESIDVEAYDE